MKVKVPTRDCAMCPACKRLVALHEGRFVTHGPSRDGRFICVWSGELPFSVCAT